MGAIPLHSRAESVPGTEEGQGLGLMNSVMAQSEQSSGHEGAGSQTVQNIRGKFLSAPLDPGFKPECEDVSSIWQSVAFVPTVLNLVYQ